MKQTSNNNKKRAPKQANKQPPKRSAEILVPHLSPCALKYARVLTNPWSVESPCIPDTITMPSQKVMCLGRGIATTGLNGAGYVSFDPFQAIWNNGASLPTASIIGTTSSYSHSDYRYVDTGTTGVFSGNTDSPWDFGALNVIGVQYRLVGAGLRMMYTGTELNRGGRLILYRSRTNQNIVHDGSVTDLVLLRDKSAVAVASSRKWESVTYVPDSPSYIGYRDVADFHPTFGGAPHKALLAYWNGTPGESYAYEAIAHFEVIGPGFQVTHSDADPIGHGAIMSSLPNVLQPIAEKGYQAILSGAYRALERTTSGLVHVGTTAAMATVSAYLATRNPRALMGAGPTIEEL